MSDGGKGSKARPLSVSQAEYDTRWDAIFGRDQVEQPQVKIWPTIQDAIKALENGNTDQAWHILRTVQDQTAHWRERAMQAEAELHTARGYK